MALFAQSNDRARQLHASSLVFDGHVHAIDRELYHGGDIGERKADGQWDLSRAKEGGLKALFFSLYVPEDYYPGRLETKQALRQMDLALQQIAKNKDRIEVALKASDIERITRSGKMAAVLDLEGSFDLDGDLGLLRMFYKLGLRSYQLSAHNWDNAYADACCAKHPWKGLTPHGRELIHEMNRLGMVINVSHASDEAMLQAIEESKQPVIATHHGMRAFNDIPRNISDELLKKLAAKGGVMGFQIGNDFHNRKMFDWKTEHAGKPFWDTGDVSKRPLTMPLADIDKLIAPQFPMPGVDAPDSVRFSVDDWVAVVDRAINLVGEDHVSLGSDFDGGPTLPRNFRDVRDLPMITEAMVRRGYSDTRIRKFLGGNLLRVFRQVTAE